MTARLPHSVYRRSRHPDQYTFHKKVAGALAALIIVLVSALVQAEEEIYYMWTDEDGVLNFSQVAPRDETFEDVSKPQRFGYPKKDKEEVKPEEPIPDPVLPVVESKSGEVTSESIARINQQVKQNSCRSARRTLGKLTSFKQIIVRGDDGFWREVSGDVRQQEVAKAEAAIAENCEPAD